jgi:hypothetical protein
MGCGRKPAYSNINVNASRPQASAEQPADAATSGANPAPESAAAKPGESPGAPPAQPPQQGSGRQAEMKMPPFFDGQTGEVKDLPSFPQAQRVSIQYGPVEGVGDMASLVLQTSVSMDRIAAFYDKAIKGSGWEVTVRNRDPEYSEWRLKKGDKDEGAVTVKKDPTRGTMIIQIVRTNKLVEKK